MHRNMEPNLLTTQPRENSAILMRNPHQTLAKLKENWELCPDERNLTAFALLFSSLWLRDEPAFRMALRHIYTLGTLEVELAHNILFRTQSTLYPDMADICHRVWREEYQAAADGYDALLVVEFSGKKKSGSTGGGEECTGCNAVSSLFVLFTLVPLMAIRRKD